MINLVGLSTFVFYVYITLGIIKIHVAIGFFKLMNFYSET